MVSSMAIARASNVKHFVQMELANRVSDLGREVQEGELSSIIEDIIGSMNLPDDLFLTEEAQRRFGQDVINDFLYYGPLQPLLDDESITEIVANGPHRIFVEKAGRMLRVEGLQFDDEAHLRRIIDRIGQQVGRRCDDSSPMMDARLLDGSRVNAIIPPLAIDGSSLTIRKFAKERMTAADLLGAGAASPAMMSFLAAAVAGRCSCIVAGGTGSGKTTMLNVLSAFIPDYERLVTIEDAAELQLNQADLVRLESRPPNMEGRGEVTIRSLVVNALRMRPDRIIVGECRSSEAIEMINAMTTGHDGSLTTIHANDIATTFSRLETMIMSGMSAYTPDDAKRLISQAVNLVVIVKRMVDGTRKIDSIVHLAGMEGDVISTEQLFHFEPLGFGEDGRLLGEFVGDGFQPSRIVQQLESRGVFYDKSWFFDRHRV